MKKAEDEKETKHSRNSFMKKEKALRLRCRERDHMSPESERDSCSLVSDSLPPHELYSPWSSPGQNTGVGSLSLLQGIFPTQGLNPGLLHCRQILYQLSHKGSPRMNPERMAKGRSKAVLFERF